MRHELDTLKGDTKGGIKTRPQRETEKGRHEKDALKGDTKRRH